MNDNNAHKLHNETQAAKILTQQLADIQGDDPEFMTAIIEGETNLFEAIEAVDKALAEDETLMQALALRITILNETPPLETPLPGALALFGSVLGLGGLGGWLKRRSKEPT